MLEVASVSLPSTLNQMKSFVANVEDLLPIKAIYKECMAEDNRDLYLKKTGADYKIILEFIKKGKDRKRHCTFVLNR